MRSCGLADFISVGALALAVAIGPLRAHSPPVLSAREIIQTLKGKICTTKAGAKFIFGGDGRYSYEGLWRSEGRYSVTDNAIIVTFVSGLERSFAISRKDGVLYMEQTSIVCAPEPTAS